MTMTMTMMLTIAKIVTITVMTEMVIVIVTVTTMVTMTRMSTRMMVTRTMTTAKTRQKAKDEIRQSVPIYNLCVIGGEGEGCEDCSDQGAAGEAVPGVLQHCHPAQVHITFSGLLIPVLDIGPDLNPFHRS